MNHWCHRRMCRLLFCLVAFLFLAGQQSCKDEDDPPIPNACSPILAEFDSTFGIDHGQVGQYKIQGDQSQLDSAYVTQIKDLIGELPNTIAGIKSVPQYVNNHFKVINAGGANIGKLTANDLFERKEVYGCHSQALIISAILRSYGFPCVMVETASVKWANEFRENPDIPYMGHVMTEVFVDGAWVLLDNNGSMVSVYKPHEPFISTLGSWLSTPAPDGLFVIGKGLDSWDYGVKDPDDTGKLMRAFAAHLPCYTRWFDAVAYSWQ